MAEPHESRVYSDLAHFYDSIFGRAFVDHEHQVIEGTTFRPGQQVLEIGVGTGISLDAYPPYVRVIGIDPSADMLAHAVDKVRENKWGHIEVRNGDAHNLDFPDGTFDWVCTFHVMTVVSDLLGTIINPLTKLLGWTTRLRARDVLDGRKITVERHERFSRLSVHYVVVARKDG
jgi:ubiquinone/menaquinone biosynthesis C-methylase UbiE